MTNDEPALPSRVARRGVARLTDVAKLAGVGTSIASRILNSDPTVGVRPETRARIVAAAQELNYSPNASARGLKLQRTTTVALVVPNLAYPVNIEIIRGAERAASAAGYVLVIADADEFLQAGMAYRRLLLEHRVDGLLLASATTSEPFLSDIVRTDLPLVLVNRRAGSLAPSVTVDDALGMRLAARHLLDLGHTTIAYVSGPPDADTAQRRLDGYLTELRRAGVEPSPERIGPHRRLSPSAPDDSPNAAARDGGPRDGDAPGANRRPTSRERRRAHSARDGHTGVDRPTQRLRVTQGLPPRDILGSQLWSIQAGRTCGATVADQ
jgi:DNA-binding LacI/PurR family transcriptional regulator